jgi:hypothetical protein
MEDRVAGLLAAEAGPAPEALEELARHARACPACAGYRDLLALLSLPGAARDVVEPPPASYWAGFDARLERRLAEGPAPAAVPARPRWLAAAAAIAALTAALAWLGRPGAGIPEPPLRAEAGPAALGDLLARSSPDVALAELERVAGLEGPWAGEAAFDDGEAEGAGWEDEDLELFPETEDLAPRARGELLRWMLEQAAPNRGVPS